MRALRSSLCLAGLLGATSFWAACAPGLIGGDDFLDDGVPGPSAALGEGGVVGAQAKPPGGELADEQFPPELLAPYTGPPIDVYDNTFVSYQQLEARVMRVFADPGIGGDTAAYFASKIGLLGGADFKEHFTEARVASSDFLLALDAVAKDACARAATNRTGPFAGSDPATASGQAAADLVASLHQRILFRAPVGTEASDALALVEALKPLSPDAVSAWAGLCEVLVRHPDSLFTLPPSVSVLTGADKERMQLEKLATDLVGRPPSDAEFAALAGKSIDEKVDAFTATPDFREFFFHRVRIRMESIGTAESDEAARLWTYLVTTGAPMQDLLTADYTVDENFQKIGRDAVHGKTGVLTMPGFIKSKPGLPHFNYAARVMTDFMGQLFELTPDIIAARATAKSTVDPGSVCIGCHAILTPLATQRLRWADDGQYRTTDEKGQPIDDSDRGMVPNYPYKGQGMEAFATQAVKKEKFYRQMFQSLFLFFLGRHMRYAEDERTVYLELWNTAYATHGDTKALIKVIAKLPGYLGK
jgi:hypothetical protein